MYVTDFNTLIGELENINEINTKLYQTQLLSNRCETISVHCLYFHLNLKYLGQPYRTYIKTAKNDEFCQEVLSKNDFEAVLATFGYYDHGAKVSGEVQKIAADQREYRKCSLCVIIC